MTDLELEQTVIAEVGLPELWDGFTWANGSRIARVICEGENMTVLLLEGPYVESDTEMRMGVKDVMTAEPRNVARAVNAIRWHLQH